MKRIIITILLMAVLSFPVFTMHGCAGHQTAVQQMLEQTHDPVYIAKASYYDGLSTYRKAQQSYMTVKPDLDKFNPDLGKKIHDDLQKAWDILKAWKATGLVSAVDREELFNLAYNILLETAARMED